MQYKLIVDDRNYESWKVYNFNSSQIDEIKLNINPLEHKLLSNDVFTFENNQAHIVHSTTKMLKNIPGILILKDGKSYGHYKNKLLYKLIPDDKRIPIFLIPYQIKVAFNKNNENKFILFKFDNWKDKHPIGTIENVIGSVIDLPGYFEYQLFCKSLYSSIQNFTKEATKKVRNQELETIMDNIMTKYNIIDRRDEEIITIDGENTLDFDDAISFHENKISIYIANVPLWMEILGLWNSFSDRVSTIYLPDRKRPMLPTILSENLCSLVQESDKLAFNIDLILENNEIKSVKYHNSRIRIKKNYIYDEKILIKNKMYKKILVQVEELNKKYNYVKNIVNSGDVITYLMILMNHFCANELIKFNCGIYRSVQFINKNKILPDHNLPEGVQQFLKIWNSSVGSYTLFDNRKPHEIMEVESYTHITSPIRRLVDMLNIIKLQDNLNLVVYSKDAHNFYDVWLNKLEYINTTMRSIRKVQTDCNLLDLFTNKEDIKKTIYQGYLFDKIERSDGLFQYMVYLDKLKMISRITMRHNKSNYEKMCFKVYLFEDEDTLKRKIRVNYID